jgi:hypothetical protein
VLARFGSYCENNCFVREANIHYDDYYSIEFSQCFICVSAVKCNCQAIIVKRLRLQVNTIERFNYNN